MSDKTTDESGTKLKACPICHQDNQLSIESSGSLCISQVACECGHKFQSGCYEENIGRYWNKHVKEF